MKQIVRNPFKITVAQPGNLLKKNLWGVFKFFCNFKCQLFCIRTISQLQVINIRAT